MKLKAHTTLLAAALIVAAGIAATMFTGLWQTVGTRVPKKLEAAVAVPLAGQTAYDPADIRGSYTFGDITAYYGIPLATLAEAFHVVESEAEAFQVKALETLWAGDVEIGTASVRMFVACYLGLPYTPAEEVWLPASAAQILATQAVMTDTQAAYVAAHTAP